MFDDDGNRTGGARMTAIVTLKPGEPGRHYRLPTDADYAAVRKAQERVNRILAEWEQGGKQGLCPVPDEPLPAIGTLGFRVQRYGMLEWGDLFTARQKSALTALGRLAAKWMNSSNGVIQTASAMAADRVVLQGSSGCRWIPVGESLADTFGRQALPIVWDFAESSPIAGSTGDFDTQMEWLAEAIDNYAISNVGLSQSADAAIHPLPDSSAGIWFTDPPYYDAIPYADLADFFLVWLKRALPNHPLLRTHSNRVIHFRPRFTKSYRMEPRNTTARSKINRSLKVPCAKLLPKDGVYSATTA